MLVGEFLERLKRGETVTRISESLGLHRKTLQRRLRRLGYRWDSQKLQWRWSGEEGEEPLGVSLIDMNMSWSKQVSQQPISHSVNKHAGEMNSHPFTQEEVEGLKQMLKQWREVPKAATASEHDLVKRIQEIRDSDNEKVRKTIVIDKRIGDKFDEYAEKTRLNKSDLLHLAIEELIEKYRLE